MKFQVAISSLLITLAAEICCMSDFLRPENFDLLNDTDIDPKLSTFSINNANTDSQTPNSDEYNTQSRDVLPWFQNNLMSKENYSSENIDHVDTNSLSSFHGNMNFNTLPYDSGVTGSQPNEQWLNNFYNQRHFSTYVPHNDHHYPSHGHMQEPHKYHSASNSWKPASYGSHHVNSNHHSVTHQPLKSNHPSVTYNKDIHHRFDAPKYKGHHPAMHHQNQNAHKVNNHHMLNKFMGDTHYNGKDFHPHNGGFGNPHYPHIEGGTNFGYPIYNPLQLKGSYHGILGAHQVGSGQDNIARPDIERFPFEFMLTKEDLESLIFEFHELGNVFMMNGEYFLNDGMGYSRKRAAGGNKGFKHFLDKFIRKTENIVRKWGPKLEKVGDAVGLVFGFLKFVSNLPVFHLHR